MGPFLSEWEAVDIEGSLCTVLQAVRRKVAMQGQHNNWKLLGMGMTSLAGMQYCVTEIILN